MEKKQKIDDFWAKIDKFNVYSVGFTIFSAVLLVFYLFLSHFFIFLMEMKMLCLIDMFSDIYGSRERRFHPF
jgi:hypothetical protein